MNFCPNTSSPEWKALVDAVGEFEAMRDFMENETIRSVSQVKNDKPDLFGVKKKAPDTLFGIESRKQIKFHANTVNAVYQFLSDIDVEAKLLPGLLKIKGSAVEGAVAAANFAKNTVDIADKERVDIMTNPNLSEEQRAKKLAQFWEKVNNKMPEEAAHWWFRLLKNESSLKGLIWNHHKTALKADDLYKTKYGNLPGINGPEDLREEAIGHLIAEAIKKVERKYNAPESYTLLKRLLILVNKLIAAFKVFKQDPFEVAAMKILSSDQSDLLNVSDYQQLVKSSKLQVHNGVAYNSDKLDELLVKNLKNKDKYELNIDNLVPLDLQNGWTRKDSIENFHKTRPFRMRNPHLDIPYETGTKNDIEQIGNRIFIKAGNNKTFKKFYYFADYKNKIVFKGKTWYFLTDKFTLASEAKLLQKRDNINEIKRAASQGRYLLKPTKNPRLSPRLIKQMLDYVDHVKNNVYLKEAYTAELSELQLELNRADEEGRDILNKKHLEMTQKLREDEPTLRKETIDALLYGTPDHFKGVYQSLFEKMPTIALVNLVITDTNLKPIIKKDPLVDSESKRIFSDKPFRKIIRTLEPLKIVPSTNAFLPEGYDKFVERVNKKIVDNTLTTTLTDKEKEYLKKAGYPGTNFNVKTKGMAVALEIGSPLRARGFVMQLQNKKRDVQELLKSKFKIKFPQAVEMLEMADHIDSLFGRTSTTYDYLNDIYDLSIMPANPIYAVLEKFDKVSSATEVPGSFNGFLNGEYFTAYKYLNDDEWTISYATPEWYEDLENIIDNTEPRKINSSDIVDFYNATAITEENINRNQQGNLQILAATYANFLMKAGAYSQDLTILLNIIETSPNATDFGFDTKSRFENVVTALLTQTGMVYKKLQEDKNAVLATDVLERLGNFVTGYTAADVLNERLSALANDINSNADIRYQISVSDSSELDKQYYKQYMNTSAKEAPYIPKYDDSSLELREKLQKAIDNKIDIRIINEIIRTLSNIAGGDTTVSPNSEFLPEGIDFSSRNITRLFFNNLRAVPQNFMFSHNLMAFSAPNIKLNDLPTLLREYITDHNVRVRLADYSKDADRGYTTDAPNSSLELTKTKTILKTGSYKESFPLNAGLFKKSKSFPFYTLRRPGEKFRVEFSAHKTNPFPKELYELFNLNHGGSKLSSNSPLGWFSGTYTNESLYITEVQSDLLQRLFEIATQDQRLEQAEKRKEEGKSELRYATKGNAFDEILKNNPSIKSNIDNYYKGWLAVFTGVGLNMMLESTPNISKIYIPTSETYKNDVSSVSPYQYYDKIAKMFPTATLTEDGKYWEINREDINTGVFDKSKDYYDVIIKSALKAGFKEQKDLTPDLGSDQYIAKTIIEELYNIDVLKDYLNSKQGENHLKEIESWIEANFSDEKPFTDDTAGGELVDSEGNVIPSEEEETESDARIREAMRESKRMLEEEKNKEQQKRDSKINFENIMDDLLDQLSDAIKSKDVSKQNYIKKLIDELNSSEDKLFGLDISGQETDSEIMFYRDQAQYSERYTVLDTPIELNESEFQQTRGNEIAEKLANKLRVTVGISSQLVTLAHAKEILDRAGKAYNGEPGFFFNGQVYLVREKMTTEIVFHEFAHPIIKAIAIDNPVLFENLYLQLSSTPEGQAIIEEVKQFYPEYSEDSSDFKEEALVRGLSRAADAKLRNQAQSSGFLAFIKELLYNVKQWFRKAFKGTKIKIENLSETTTLDQLADMLMSESFQISTQKVTDADIVAFARDTRQQMIEDLAAMEQNELSKLSKNMFDMLSKQSKVISSKNYKEIRETLSDTMQRSDIKEILGNLRMFQREGDVKFETAEDEIKYMNAHAEAFLNSMNRFNLASRRILEHFKKISGDVNKPENIARAFYLNRIIRDWGLFLNDIKSELRTQEYSEYIGPGNPLLGLINEIEETLTRTKAYSDKIYTTGVKDTIIDQLQPMAATIDNYYTNILKRYEEKGAPAEVINRVKREYEEVRLTPKKIDQLLKGELGDAGAINSFLEGYMNNQDPIIFGFAGYVKDRFTAMNAVIQKQFNTFISSVSDLVDAAGYTTAYSRMHMGKDLLFLDTVRNESEGKEARKVWKFLNPWMDFEKDLRDLENKVEETKKEFNEKKTDESEQEYFTAVKNLKDFRDLYLHQQYTEEYNKLREFFQDEVGKKAEALRSSILNKIQGLNSTVTSFDQIMDNLDMSEVYWREYRLLYSLYYADGSPKEVDSMDYKIAVRLREHRNLSNKFTTWTPRKGAFQNAYLNFKQSLIDNGIKPTGKTAKEFKEKLEEWVGKNTVIKLNKKFYEDRAEIFAKLAELSTEPDQLKIVENYKKIANIISAYKDKNSEPVGSEMPEKLLQAIKEIEEEIEELKESLRENSKALTSNEYDFYVHYKDLIAAGDEPSEEEIDEFRRIKQKMKKRGITEDDLAKSAQIFSLYNKLNALQKRETSNDFIEMVNDFLTSDPESLQILKKSFKLSRFSASDIKMLEDEAMVEKLFAVNPKFKDWFLANTIARTSKKKGTKYYPTRAWTYIKPQDSSYYEKTEIKDDQGRPIETIPGVPSLTYWYKEVLDDYVNDAGEVVPLKTKRVTMLDCIRQGIPIENATVDMRGNFLPKLSGGNKYRNENYFLLEKNSPAKFKLLQELIKQHLMLQEEMPYDSRLDLESPRYRKSGLEAIASTPISDTIKQNPLAVWARKIKSFFWKSADDLEMGLNPEEQSVVIKSDLYDDSNGRVPITGMYDIEPDQVSMDIMTGMMRYMQSGVRQKTLLDMMPTARALQSIVQNPDNNPDIVKDGVKIFSKAKMTVASVLTPQSQKALSIRAQAINAFIEREFEGKTQAGFTKNMIGLNKTVSALFGLSSKAFFAFNIPSALKNSFGSRFQAIIEGAGGKYFNWADYMKGTVWGNKVTAEISMELYKFGPKSLDVQLFEMMDPSQGRLTSKISQGTGISRSVFTDTAELGFLTNVRKWTELNATAGVFGAMLKKTMIERTMPDGSVSKVSYDDAWEVVDGQIKLKSGIDKKWDVGGASYNNFIRNLHGVINNLNGAYASFDSPNANRYLLFRFMMYMKTYFTRMFMNRFQFRYEKGMILPRYDANLNDISMGYYVEFLTGIKNLLVRYKGNVSLMTPNEVTAMRKTVVEVGMLLLISELIVGFLFDFDPDDEDKYEKLRQKSGPFPGLFVAEDEHPFKASGWFSNHMLNLALQVRAENDSFIPYPRWGLQDYGNLLNMESVSLQATLDMYIKLFTGITDYADYKLTGDNTALYKREVGPYYWQQEGGVKFVNHLAKTLSLSGTTVEPVVAISGLQSRENR